MSWHPVEEKVDHQDTFIIALMPAQILLRQSQKASVPQ
jgi:hypothetical protein